MIKTYKIKEPVSSFDQHWRPPSIMCHPCQIKYDFIGKMETVIKDSKYLMKILNVENKDLFPGSGGSKYNTKTKHLIDELFF